MAHLKIVAVGGTSFDSYLDDEYLGRVEFGDLDDEGQYMQDDDEIADYIREVYGIDENTQATVK